jgi:hypothetical protein
MIDAFISAAPLHQQYFARSAPTSDRPEKRLLFAVLLNAITHLQSPDVHDAAEAEHWIRSNDTSESPFSFHSICEVLGIDAHYLGRGLLTWCSRATSVAPRAPLRHIRVAHARIAPTRERSGRRVSA